MESGTQVHIHTRGGDSISKTGYILWASVVVVGIHNVARSQDHRTHAQHRGGLIQRCLAVTLCRQDRI